MKSLKKQGLFVFSTEATATNMIIPSMWNWLNAWAHGWGGLTVFCIGKLSCTVGLWVIIQFFCILYLMLQWRSLDINIFTHVWAEERYKVKGHEFLRLINTHCQITSGRLFLPILSFYCPFFWRASILLCQPSGQRRHFPIGHSSDMSM